MQYVVLKDEETDEVEIVGRFEKFGIGEVWQNGKWAADSVLVSNLFDGLLETISEAEAIELITKHFQTEKIAA